MSLESLRRYSQISRGALTTLTRWSKASLVVACLGVATFVVLPSGAFLTHVIVGGALVCVIVLAVATLVSKRRLEQIFGCAPRRAGRSSAAVDVGQGTASLGCLIPRRRPALYLRSEGQFGPALRIRVDDGDLDVWVAVTDLRLYQADHETPDRPAVQRLRQRLREPGAVILSVGLTRAFTPSTEKKPMHWLQVNNVHSERNPTWQLG